MEDEREGDVFFFQAEDGIRDRLVTGVQTCALPISAPHLAQSEQVTVERYRHIQFAHIEHDVAQAMGVHASLDSGAILECA